MKHIHALLLLVTLSILPYAAKAETAITDAMSQKYFDNCVAGAQKEGTMTPDTQQKYCACTAMNMQQSMSQEDISALSASDKTVARAALNKVILNVNGPCMEYPVHDLIEKKCLTDLKNPAICTCLSKKMGQFMAQQSQSIMPQILAANPDIYDPFTPILESPVFQQKQQSIALSCATNPNQ